MPDITFNCPKCDQELEAPEDFAGQAVECPGCSTEITVPQAATAKEADVEDDLDSEESEEADSEQDHVEDGVCPECGAEMDPDSVLCLGCGYHSRLGRKIRTDFDNS